MNEEQAMKLLTAHINIDQELLVSTRWLKMSTTKNGRMDDIFFVLTEFSIYLFQSDKDNKNLIQYSKNSLFDMKCGNVINMNTFAIRFTDSTDGFITFYGEDASFLMNLIVSQLDSIMLQSEKPSIVGDFNKVYSHKSYLSVLARFRGKLKRINRYPPQSFLEEIQAYLKTEPTELDLSQFKDINNYLDVILESIEIEPKISRLVFIGDQKINHWNHLSIYMRSNATIERITISEHLTRAFIDFCTSISKNTNSNLKRIDFIDVDFQTEHLEALDRMIQAHPLRAISFTNCDVADNKNTLASLLKTNVPTNGITSLHMSSINMGRISQLAQAALSLRYISLRGCCLEIAELLNMLKSTQVVTVDFSKNRCTQLINQNCTLPSTLHRLSLNDITWTTENFKNLLLITSECLTEISLSVANALLTESEWISVFDLMGVIPKTNFCALTWRGNPIHYKFAQFISNSSKLSFLSISGCIVPGDGSMHRLLEGGKSLRYLECHGCGDVFLGESGYGLLKSLALSKIERIDISDNHLGQRCVVPLISFLKNEYLKEIILSGNDFPVTALSETIPNTIKNVNKDLAVRFPDEIKQAGLPALQVKTLRTVYKCPEKRSGGTVADEEWAATASLRRDAEQPISVPDDPAFQPPPPAPRVASAGFAAIGAVGPQQERIEEEVPRTLISWKLEGAAAPPVDNNEIMRRLASQFTLQATLDRLVLSI